MTDQPRQILYTPVDVDDADFVNLDTDPRVEAENAEFEAFKAEMHDSQDDAKITVGKKLTDSRGRPMGKKTMECFECGIDDYTFSQLCTRIREDFGTGLYLIQGRDSGGKFKFKKVVGIQAPIDPDAGEADSSPATLIQSMSHAMADQQDRFERMIQNLGGPAQKDPIEQMTSMMTAMGGMMTALGMGSQNNPAPKTMIETLTELKLTKDLVGDLMGGGEGSGQIDNFWGAIAKTAESFGGPLLNAISLAQQQGKINPDGVIQPPKLPAPEPEIKETPPADPDTNAMTLKEMREQLEFLLIQAKNDVKHSIVVDFIIDQLPDEDSAYDAFEQFLQDGNCIDRCAMILPEINNYRAWFGEWRTAMLMKLEAMIESGAVPDLMSDYPQKDDLSSTKSEDSKEQSSLTSEPEKPDDAATPAQSDSAGDALTDSGHDAATGKDGDPLNPDGNPERGSGDLRNP